METGKLIDLPYGPARQTTWLQALCNRADDTTQRMIVETNRLKCFAHIAKWIDDKGLRKCSKK